MPHYLSHSVLKRAVALVVDTPLVLVLYLGQLEVMDRLPGEPDRHGEVSVIASHGGPYDEVSLGVIPLSQLLLRLFPVHNLEPVREWSVAEVAHHNLSRDAVLVVSNVDPGLVLVQHVLYEECVALPDAQPTLLSEYTSTIATAQLMTKSLDKEH